MSCYADFLWSVRSAARAQDFADKCLKAREPGFLEKLILDRARGDVTAPVEGVPPADGTNGDAPPSDADERAPGRGEPEAH